MLDRLFQYIKRYVEFKIAQNALNKTNESQRKTVQLLASKQICFRFNDIFIFRKKDSSGRKETFGVRNTRLYYCKLLL